MPDVLTTMTHTYQATGIILKGMPLGEYDRLVSILTPEYGLIRAVAPGARKYKSKLRGRCELFVVNQLLIVKGRSLEKLIQAETLESHPGLSRDLGKLSASQYLAELVLLLALSDQPQTELYELLLEHLQRIERQEEPQALVANIAQAVFHLLAIAGIAPEVHRCCLTQGPIVPNFTDPQWRVGFSFEAGGLIGLNSQLSSAILDNHHLPIPKINSQLRIIELILLQQLGNPFLPQLSEIVSHPISPTSVELSWIRLERLLRDYAQYHLGHSFRSASLVESLSPLEF